MVKHIILWKLKDGFSAREKQEIKLNAKKNLEALIDLIDGLEKMEITISSLPSSNADMMLYSEFSDVNALANYSASQEHKAVADKYVRPFVQQRLCLDF